MTSYPLTLPATPAPREQSVEAVNHVAETVSPFTGTSQVQEWSGAEYWKLTRSYPPMDATTAGDWSGTFAALRGKAGLFYAGSSVETTRGSAAISSKNLWKWSQGFDNSAWVKQSCSVSPNIGTAAPDGTLTADKLIEDSSNAVHYIGQNEGAITDTRSISVYALPSGRSWIFLQIGSSATAYFDVASGVLGSISSGATATIAPAGNGWYRCTLSATGAGNTNRIIGLASGSGQSTYAGNGTSGVAIWGAQNEAGLTPTSYIGTTSVAGSAPCVNGANQTGRVLLIDGCPPSSSVFKRGDLFQLGAGCGATRIQSSGGTGPLKTLWSYGPGTTGQRYVVSVGVKNFSSLPMKVSTNLGSFSQTISPNAVANVEFNNVISNGVGFLQLRFETNSAGDSLNIVAWNPVVRRFGIDENLITPDSRTFSLASWGQSGGATITLTQGVGQRLYRVTEDVVSDSLGNAEVPIWPFLRNSPFDDEPLVVTNPKGVFRLDSNNRKYSINQIKHFGFTLSAKEAL